MLTSDSPDASGGEGSFEEFDLDPKSPRPVAQSVAGRPYGQNKAAVVFGLIRTPTEKVPEGMLRVLVLSDPTMGMGALSAPECDRLVAAFDLAESLSASRSSGCRSRRAPRSRWTAAPRISTRRPGSCAGS